MKKTSDKKSREIVFTNNFLFYLNLIRSIQRAQSRIDISLYIFETDRVGHLVLSKLLEASRRGVKVTLLLDGLGSFNSYAKIEREIENHPNFIMSLYNPFPWPFSKQRLHRHRSKNSLFSLLIKLNRRNHSKFFIFDNKTVYLGSHNIFDQSRFWRETSVKIENHEVSRSCRLIMNWLLGNSFFLQRSINKKVKQRFKINKRIYFSHSMTTNTLFRKKLIDQINNANHKIQIIIPYFFPPISIILSLIKAAKRGVRVEIIIPRVSDVFLFPRISRLFYSRLIEGGVSIYEYTNGMIHSKQFRIDNWVVVGSSNLNSRSLFKDIEVDYSIQEKSCMEKINLSFEKDKLMSKHIDEVSQTLGQKIINLFLAKIFGFWI